MLTGGAREDSKAPSPPFRYRAQIRGPIARNRTGPTTARTRETSFAILLVQLPVVIVGHLKRRSRCRGTESQVGNSLTTFASANLCQCMSQRFRLPWSARRADSNRIAEVGGHSPLEWDQEPQHLQLVCGRNSHLKTREERPLCGDLPPHTPA